MGGFPLLLFFLAGIAHAALVIGPDNLIFDAGNPSSLSQSVFVLSTDSATGFSVSFNGSISPWLSESQYVFNSSSGVGSFLITASPQGDSSVSGTVSVNEFGSPSQNNSQSLNLVGRQSLPFPISETQNSTAASQVIRLSSVWRSNVPIIGYLVSLENGGGQFNNYSTSVPEWNFTSTSLDNAPICYQFYAFNNESGMNSTPISCFLTTDNQEPQYGNLTLPSAIVNTTIAISQPWWDNSQLANVTMWLDNGNGTTYPYITERFSSNYLNSVKNATITFSLPINPVPGPESVYFVGYDGEGNANITPTYNFNAFLPPVWSNASVNDTLGGHYVKFSLNLSSQPSYSIANATFFIENGDGVVWNQSENLSGNPSVASFNASLNPTGGRQVCWWVSFSDTNGDTSTTTKQCFYTYAPPAATATESGSILGSDARFSASFESFLPYPLTNATLFVNGEPMETFSLSGYNGTAFVSIPITISQPFTWYFVAYDAGGDYSFTPTQTVQVGGAQQIAHAQPTSQPIFVNHSNGPTPILIPPLDNQLPLWRYVVGAGALIGMIYLAYTAFRPKPKEPTKPLRAVVQPPSPPSA